MLQNRALEKSQVRTGLEAQLLRQRLAETPIRLQRFSLSAASVKREHELGTEALPGRVQSDETLELGDELGVATELEISIDPVLERGKPELFQPRALSLDEVAVPQVRERWTAPQGERLAQQN